MADDMLAYDFVAETKVTSAPRSANCSNCEDSRAQGGRYYAYAGLVVVRTAHN